MTRRRAIERIAVGKVRALQAERDAALAGLAMLRAELTDIVPAHIYHQGLVQAGKKHIRGCYGCRVEKRVTKALADTAASADAYLAARDERVRAEEREACVLRLQAWSRERAAAQNRPVHLEAGAVAAIRGPA